MRIQDGVDAWISRVERARSPMSAWLALVVTAAVLGMTVGVLGPFAARYTAALQHRDLSDEILARLVGYAIILSPFYLVALICGRVVEGRKSVRGPVSATNAAVIGLSVAVLGFLLVLPVQFFSGCLQLEQSGVAVTVVGLIAGGVLLAFQAGAEECLFRGWLQPILLSRWGVWPGVVAAAALFAAAHLTVIHGPIAAINTFLAGMMFGLLALRTGRLWAPVLAHWGWNFIEQSVLGLTPNPGIDRLGSVFDFKLVGPDFAGAGPDELTGSVFVMLVFAILVVIGIALPRTVFTSSAFATHRSGRAP